MLRRRSPLAPAALALLACAAGVRGQEAPAAGGPALAPELQAARDALARYEKSEQAELEAFTAIGCIDYGELPPDTTKKNYGAMTVEVEMLNYAQATSGDVDPEKPAALLYARPPDGPLELAGAVWMVPAKPGMERPTLFGQPFEGPMIESSTTPLVKINLKQYELHAWLWRENPRGTFARTNPTLPCVSDGYSIRAREAPR